MKLNRLGESELRVSEIALGTMTWGEQNSERDAHLQLDFALAHGRFVQSALFENNVFLVAQHMMQYAVTGVAAAPMPQRLSAWAIYDVFDTADGAQLFVAVVSDAQWNVFCARFGLDELAADALLATNNQRVHARIVGRTRLYRSGHRAPGRRRRDRGSPVSALDAAPARNSAARARALPIANLNVAAAGCM
jgi:CoA-transferase family III